jgi:hypothetical protein
MDYTKLTVAELANAMITTETAIRRCREILDDLQEPKTVGLQAVVVATRNLLAQLEQDLKALSNTASPLQATVWSWSSAPELTNQVIAAITQQRRFPEPFVREIEERFGDCLDTDYSAGRCNGMSGIVAGKQPNEGERVHRGERAPRCGLDCRPNMRAEPHR